MVTRACNLRCKYCYFRDSDYKPLYMELETAKKIIDKCGAYCRQNKKELTIHFFGGEPLLNFELIKKMTEYASSRLEDVKLGYTITTNGTLFTKEIAEFLKKNNFEVRVSFDGCMETHDKQRVAIDGKGSSKDILEGIKFFRNYLKMSINMTVTQQSAGDVTKGALELWENGAYKIKLQCTMNEFWEKGNIIKLRSELMKLSKTYVKLKSQGKKVHLTKLENFDETETCIQNMYHNLFFEYNGDCTICGCASIGNKKRVWSLGNINSDNFLEKLDFLKFDMDDINYFKGKAVKNKKIMSLLQTHGLMFCDIINRTNKDVSLKDYVKNKLEISRAFKEAHELYAKLIASNQNGS